jgi:hypothetical protein
MFYWIYDYPPKYVGALFALAFVTTTWFGILVFRPIVRSWIHHQRPANDMVGFALSSFSMVYGILLGLIAVASYQNFTAVSELVTKEASTLAALYRDLSGYPQSIRGSLNFANIPEKLLRRVGRSNERVSSGNPSKSQHFMMNSWRTIRPSEKRQ